ncbi:MAG: FHA domain-containing protein [Herpetosiphonaceae bacterium]|nr:FHA domain-containing protein [Herpetosiphonaceae bacterium]
MLICSGCHSQQYTGTIFCPLCGANCLPEDRPRTLRASLQIEQTPPAALTVVTTPLSFPEPELRATLLHNGRPIKLPLHVPVLIGRADTRGSCYPELDLTNDGGYQAGVSRQHARISNTAQETYIEDLESGNGTFVNDRQVAAGTLQRLHAGDELRIGSIVIRIDSL